MAKEEEHFVAKIAQKVIIEKDDTILLVRDPRVDEEFWELPGGRLNKGELPEEGVKREVKEELGIDVELTGVVGISSFHFAPAGGDHLLVVYKAHLKDPEAPFVLQPEEIAEVRWISKAQLYDQNVWDDLLRVLEIYFKIGDK